MSSPYATPGAPSNLGPNIPDLERFYLNQNPDAAWWRYLSLLGLTGNTQRARWGQQQFNRVQGNYMSQAPSNPNMGIYDWLTGGLGVPNLGDEFAAQTPGQRGDFTYRNIAPKARYVIG